MRIITLCGSTKFKREFEIVNKLLTLRGDIVFSVGLFGHSGDKITDKEKALLDKVHRMKIKISNEIFVINVGGYIGQSTNNEITYAETLGKKVRYLSLSKDLYPEVFKNQDPLLETRKIIRITWNWSPSGQEGNGDRMDLYPEVFEEAVVGKREVKGIEFHSPLISGDRLYYIIQYNDGSFSVIFNPNIVVYK